jgi:hypothetical protein
MRTFTLTDEQYEFIRDFVDTQATTAEMDIRTAPNFRGTRIAIATRLKTWRSILRQLDEAKHEEDRDAEAPL